MAYLDGGFRVEGTTVHQRIITETLILGALPASLPASTKAAIFAASATQVPLRLRLAAAHTAEALTVESSAGSILSTFRQTGALILGGSALSGTEILRALGTVRIEGALTQLTGAVSLTANAASSFTTSVGALTLTAAAASTWSTAAGALTLSGFAGINLQNAGVTIASVGTIALTLAAGMNLSGAAGAGSLTLGLMIGDTTLPTGSIAWTGAAARTVSLVGLSSITLTAGAASVWSTTAGALTLTSAASATWSTAAGVLTLNGFGGIDIQHGASSTLLTSATGVTLQANKNLVGAAGTGALTLGSMTGDTALPTGALAWAGAATKTASFVGTAAITITAGAASVWSTSAGALTLTSAAAATWSTAAGLLTISGFANIALQNAAATVMTVAAAEVFVAANITLRGTAGTGGLSFGSMTGTTSLPTGNLNWAGAAAQTASLVGQSTFTITAGAASTWSSSTGALTLTSAAAATWSTAAGILTLQGATELVLNGQSATTRLRTAGSDRVVVTNSALTVQAGVTLATTGTGNINLPNNASARFQIEGAAVTATVTAAEINTLCGDGGTIAYAAALRLDSSSTSPYVFENNSDTAGVLETLTLSRVAPTPANGKGTRIALKQLSSTSVERIAAAIDAQLTDITNASEDGQLEFYTISDGTLSRRLTLSNSGHLLPEASSQTLGSAGQMWSLVRATTGNFNEVTSALFVEKNADEFTSSDTVLTADALLKLSLAVGTYRFEIHARVTGNSTMDFKYTMAGSGGLVVSRIFFGGVLFDNGATAHHSIGEISLGAAVTLSIADGFSHWLLIQGSVTVTTAGTLELRWAQGTSDAGTLTVFAGATIWGLRMS